MSSISRLISRFLLFALRLLPYALRHYFLFVAQRLNWIQPGGFQRRV